MLDPFDPTPPKATPVAAAKDPAVETTVDEVAATAEPGQTDAAPAESVEDVAELDDDEVFEADEVLVDAVDQARTALELITPADTIGEPLGYIVEGEHVLSLLFDCLMTGYPGWRWTVSLTRVDEDSAPQVLETELMPGDDSLLAPEWVPWSDRLADSKVAEELAAAGLAGDDDDDDDDDHDDDDDDDHDDDDHDDDDHDDDDDDDDDDHDDDDSDDDDESAESDDAVDNGVDVLDGIDVDEALVASEHHEAEAAEAEAQTDDGAPQPPAQAGVIQFSSENESQHQQD
ncbi:DUF3027 domain-containing protein [Cryobacterium lactosi]|nr:DUF3027 domain-containing protein [Cryobacterium lactosi]